MTNVGLIGGGNMGTAILAGIRQKYAVMVCEQDQKRAGFLKRRFAVKVADLAAVVHQSGIVILAVKPQNFEEVLAAMRPHACEDQVIVSIAAGITCRYIEKRLGSGIRVVRTMPNLPAQTGEGMTGICAGKTATHADLQKVRQIFNCIGKTVVVEEKWMDTVTAVSGSGPAYVFLFAECMEKAARSLGLEKEIAAQLTAQTFKGSVALLEQSKESAEVLRARVTSKGGTTQAALAVFERHQIKGMFQEALTAARQRAKQLSK